MNISSDGCLKCIGYHEIINGVLIIPEGVKSLGVKVCYHVKELQVVVLPKSLKIIYGGAFENCTNLMVVVMQEGVEVIGADAFNNCKKLSYINIPRSVNKIYNHAFAGCISLTSIDITDTTELQDSTVFEGCTSLKKINSCNVKHFGDIMYIPLTYFATHKYKVTTGVRIDQLNKKHGHETYIKILEKLATFDSDGKQLYTPHSKHTNVVVSMLGKHIYYYDKDELGDELDFLKLIEGVSM